MDDLGVPHFRKLPYDHMAKPTYGVSRPTNYPNVCPNGVVPSHTWPSFGPGKGVHPEFLQRVD